MNKQAIIGSKISLISRAGIRYEGILYTIDSNNSTVALAKVKSYGTEDRFNDRVIAPREEIYDYIIFRGNDIQDLHVCEPPSIQDQLMTQDPAIVKVAGKSSSNRMPRPRQRKVQFTERYQAENYHHWYDSRRERSYNYSNYNQYPERSRMDYYQQNSRRNNRISPSGYRSDFGPSMRENSNQPNYFQRRRGSSRQRRWRSSSQNENSKPKKSQQVKKRYDKEYDFESANAEIAKELERLTLEQSPEVCGGGGDGETTRAVENTGSGHVHNLTSNQGDNSNSFYNSKRSFFDNISSEVTDRAKGKTIRPLNWRDERKLNVETFGFSSQRRNNYYNNSNGGRNNFYDGNSRPGYYRSRGWRNYYGNQPDNNYYYYQQSWRNNGRRDYFKYAPGSDRR